MGMRSFSHKGANARSALTTLNDCIGAPIPWRIRVVCLQSEELAVALQAAMRVCSHHHWLVQVRGLVLPVVIFHVLAVYSVLVIHGIVSRTVKEVGGLIIVFLQAR